MPHVPRKHNTVHHIRTTPDPPVSSAPRRLAPYKLKITRNEFQQILNNGLAKGSRPVDLAGESLKTFEQCKEDLRNAALLTHPHCEAKLLLTTNASDVALGAVLQQYQNE
ncbi:hypothetical protein EVAR_96697_1 [Eumeta japonica]|uniref:Reverse transcriptase/retrotransposon-derived protein RNase H-like domain-containing protein n=1 Tax=Eumeta variegata TaxID=151549 RepID=A0A4C1WH18_EUMVA|nr:hypothetical protein EVAR_96697_1 [Eumeta japonica]